MGAARETRSARNFGRSRAAPLSMGSRASQGWSRAFWVEQGSTGGARLHPKPPGSTPKFGSAPRLPAGCGQGVEPGSPLAPQRGGARLPPIYPRLGSRGSPPCHPPWGVGELSSPLGGAEERSPRRWRHQQPSHVSHSRQRTIPLGRPRGAGNPQRVEPGCSSSSMCASPDYSHAARHDRTACSPSPRERGGWHLLGGSSPLPIPSSSKGSTTPYQFSSPPIFALISWPCGVTPLVVEQLRHARVDRVHLGHDGAAGFLQAVRQ